MPNGQKPRGQTAVSPTTLDWKNSLLMKDTQKNPVDYFQDVILKNRTFEALFNEIGYLRDEGEVLLYSDTVLDHPAKLTTFIVVLDRRGNNWICPIKADNKIQQIVPLNMKTDEFDSTFIDYGISFGQAKIDQDQFIRACRLGFENASGILLGDACVKLHPDYNLVACFSILVK